ncbi:MAG: hypothetical protein Q8L48_42305 [Archangium sp.]|nr:hypothetical protein [Archangium sp.]
MTDAKKDKVLFVVRWTGTQKAQLLYLIDNGVAVVDPTDDERKRSTISIEYEAGTAAVRHLEWSVWFANKEIEDLEAVVSINDGKEQSLDTADSMENRWASEGNARRVAK